jgi:hypothetical protein
VILLTAILLISLEAIQEGLKTRKKHIASEFVEFVYLVYVTLIVFAWVSGQCLLTQSEIPFWKIIGGYVLLRFGIFDLIWNLSAGQSLVFIGSTKAYDRFWEWIIKKGKVAIGLIWFVRFICVCISLAWLLNYKQ